MRTFRPQRVGALIQKELTLLLAKEIEFSGYLVTITDVEVKDKLEHAVVKFSVYPSEKFKEAKSVLGANVRKLQFMLSRKLNIKPMPRIEFHEDYGFENAAAVEKALLQK